MRHIKPRNTVYKRPANRITTSDFGDEKYLDWVGEMKYMVLVLVFGW